MILLHYHPQTTGSLTDIVKRQRDCEGTITLEYLQNLDTAYQDFIKNISTIIPVIKVSWGRFANAEVPPHNMHRPHTLHICSRKWLKQSRKSTPQCTSFGRSPRMEPNQRANCHPSWTRKSTCIENWF